LLLIKNGKIMTMTGGNIEKGSILIKYGKIENIGIDIEIPQKCEVINVNGAWVLPGLIDAHCHIGILEETIGFEGRDLNEATDPITPQLRAIDGINPMDPAFKEAVKAGITSVMTGPGSTNVIGGQFLVMKTNSICVDDGVIFNHF
jgi:imidazolonepropionase-like amidohydrolase